MKYIRRTSYDIKTNFLENLLEDRKIIKKESDFKSKFFNPTVDLLIDNTMLLNVNKGIALLKNYLFSDSIIYILVDADMDGFTSAAVTYLYLERVKKTFDLNYTIEYILPEGKEHGLATKMNLFLSKKSSLLIIPDAASNDHNEIQQLYNAGYEILVLDHHNFDKYDENAVVINNQGGGYENPCLSGVGVVYKFLKSVDKLLNVNYADDYLDLVASGLCGDMMNLNTLENRYICETGMSNIKNIGLKEIIKAQAYSLFGIKTEDCTDNFMSTLHLTPIQISFYIAPLINALIRVGSSQNKEVLFEALINGERIVPSTKRGHKGEEEMIATQNARNCVNCRTHQNNEKEKAIELLDIQIQNDCLDENKILILKADELEVSNTLTGLVAMGVAAKYKKPVLLGRTTPDGLYLKGSIRGVNGSELTNFRGFLLSSGLMEFVEGHNNAAGFGVKISNISKLLDYANKELKDINFNEGFYEVDFIKNCNDPCLEKMIFDLDKGKYIYGQDCPEPVVVIKDVPLSATKICGSKQDTLQIKFGGITGVKFKAASYIEQLSGATHATIIGKTKIHHWNGYSIPQIMIDDLEVYTKDNSIDLF